MQISGAVALVFGAGLLARSVAALEAVDPGFDPEGVLSVRLSLPAASYAGPGDVLDFQARAIETLRATPGVSTAGAVSMMPFEGGGLCDGVAAAGREGSGIECAEYRMVRGDYFAAMKIRFLSGRPIDEGDVRNTARVAMLTRVAAELLFPAGDALGQTITGRGAEWEVVGVVEDVRHFGLDREPTPEVYLPFAQSPVRFFTLVARASGDSAAALRDVEGGIIALDPSLALRSVVSLQDLVRESTTAYRFRRLLAAGFGALALLVAATGIGGLLSYRVRARTREIGIRMAIGASGRAAAGMVISETMRVVVVGLALGAAGAWGTGRLLASWLFGVSPADPITGLQVLAWLAIVALAAAAIPVRRAVRVEPVEALRSD